MVFNPTRMSLTGEEFWCHCCDHIKVSSDDPNTGAFYSQFGHEYTDAGVTEEWKQVVFALCLECDPFKEAAEDTVKELFANMGLSVGGTKD